MDTRYNSCHTANLNSNKDQSERTMLAYSLYFFHSYITYCIAFQDMQKLLVEQKCFYYRVNGKLEVITVKFTK